VERRDAGDGQDQVDFGAESHADREGTVSKESMSDQSMERDDMPAEVDFSKGTRGLHHVPSRAKVFMPTSIEKDVWEYFSNKAEQRGIELPELLSEVLKRDIEINEALK
jgi:hypothetical protein